MPSGLELVAQVANEFQAFADLIFITSRICLFPGDFLERNEIRDIYINLQRLDRDIDDNLQYNAGASFQLIK